jgi:cytochrome c biogenesis protein CcdA
MGEVSVFIAFTAGILSFLSPCVLPIVPGYLSYLSGVAGAQEQPKGFNFKVFLASILFVLGFSLVFTLLGASATTVGQFLRSYQDLIAKVGGGVVVFFGLHFAGAFLRPNFLREILGFSAFLVALFLFSAISQKLLFDLLGIVLIVLFLYAFGVHEKLYAQKRLEVKSRRYSHLWCLFGGHFLCLWLVSLHWTSSWKHSTLCIPTGDCYAGCHTLVCLLHGLGYSLCGGWRLTFLVFGICEELWKVFWRGGVCRWLSVNNSGCAFDHWVPFGACKPQFLDAKIL